MALLEGKSYWEQVDYDIRSSLMYSLKFFKTSIEEINLIIPDFQEEIQTNHVNRIRSLARTAAKTNEDIAKAWHQDYYPGKKDYGNPDFAVVEEMYKEARGMAIDMVDLGNLAARLNDFVGKRGIMLKWYKNQGKEIRAAIIGGAFLIGAAIITGTIAGIIELVKPNPPIVIYLSTTETIAPITVTIEPTKIPTLTMTSQVDPTLTYTPIPSSTPTDYDNIVAVTRTYFDNIPNYKIADGDIQPDDAWAVLTPSPYKKYL